MSRNEARETLMLMVVAVAVIGLIMYGLLSVVLKDDVEKRKAERERWKADSIAHPSAHQTPKPYKTHPLVTSPAPAPGTTPRRALAYDDAYDQGYYVGFEQGTFDGDNGLTDGSSYDDSNDLSGKEAQHYRAGYKNGYNDGFSQSQFTHENS